MVPQGYPHHIGGRRKFLSAVMYSENITFIQQQAADREILVHHVFVNLCAVCTICHFSVLFTVFFIPGTEYSILCSGILKCAVDILR